MRDLIWASALGGVRTSTVLTVLAFVIVGASPTRRRGAVLGGLAWLFGFEAVYQVTQFAVRGQLPPWRWEPLLLLPIAAALTVAARSRVSRGWLLLAAAIWIAWLLSGFHVNGHGWQGFDPLAETFNEGAKTALAIAYLWPLWRTRPRLELRGAPPRAAALQPTR